MVNNTSNALMQERQELKDCAEKRKVAGYRTVSDSERDKDSTNHND
jgi:hypothetical protein